MSALSAVRALVLLSAAALAAGTAVAQSAPAKKALVQRVVALQQTEIEGFAHAIVERPAVQMMRDAGLALQQQLPGDKREAAGRQIEAEVKKYVDEAYPIVRKRALELAPTTIGAVLEQKMTEDELKALLAWLESPTNKKYQQLGAELRNTFTQKLLGEMPPVLDPKLRALDERIRAILGVPAAGAQAPATAASK